MNNVIGKKCVSLIVIVTFLLSADGSLLSQSEDEIVSQFHHARSRYVSGQYQNTRKRIERVIGIMSEKQVDRNDILGKCYLLLGAIYEKESKTILAEENYKKAINEYGISLVAKVDLESLVLYRKVVKGEGNSQRESFSGTIEKLGRKKKSKKKFPWLLVSATVVIAGVVAFLLFKKKKKKKYTLTVTLGDGIAGSPAKGIHTFTAGETVTYNYSVNSGYGSMTVKLNSRDVPDSGTITMNANHSLVVTAGILTFETTTRELEIPEGGSKTFGIRLSGRPPNDVQVIVRHAGGDTDILVGGDSDFIFTTANWEDYQLVNVYANADYNTTNDTAIIRISARAAGIPDKEITVKERDGSILQFITNNDDVTIPEMGEASIRLKLSFQPDSDVAVVVETVANSDEDIFVKPGYGNFTIKKEKWDTFHDIFFQASADTDTHGNTARFIVRAPGLTGIPDKIITVIENDIDILHFITNSNNVTVNESSDAELKVRLSAKPINKVIASVTRILGDDGITVSPESLSFDTGNWSKYQTIRVSAAADANIEDGEAIIRISAPNVKDDKDITVVEKDNDTIDLETDTGKITVQEGKSASFSVRLTARPLEDLVVKVTRTSGAENITVDFRQLVFAPDNFDSWQHVQVFAANDEDQKDSTSVISLSHKDIKTKTVSVTEIDQHPGDVPSVAIKFPQNGDILSDEKPVDIIAVANDQYSGVKEVQFYIDGKLTQVVAGNGSSHVYTWDTTEVTAGIHEIKAVAIDYADHKGQSEVASVIVSDTVPTVSIDAFSDSIVSATVDINMKAADFRGVASLKFYLGETELTPWKVGPSRAVEYTFPLDTFLYESGTYTFSVIAVDTGNQESEPASITFTIQNY